MKKENFDVEVDVLYSTIHPLETINVQKNRNRKYFE